MNLEGYFIHASNIHGLGARQVVRSFLSALREMDVENLTIALPDDFEDEGSIPQKNTRILFLNRGLPKSLSRLLECVFPTFYFSIKTPLIVLGDIPLRGIPNQVVLVHQPNLIKPAYDPYSSKRLNFRIMRWLFQFNLSFVKTVIVQTTAMKTRLVQSYPELRGRIAIIPQPAPKLNVHLSNKHIRRGLINSQGLILYYPAAGYPHKNHKVILELKNTHESLKECLHSVIVTLTDDELETLKPLPPWIDTKGRLTLQKSNELYYQVDALIFPSLTESYGLPLIEAMVAGLPIVCSDLPYARCLCGNQAIYFHPTNPQSLMDAIEHLHRRLSSGWQPDWSQPLSKLPDNWQVVVESFLQLSTQDTHDNLR
jgi:glycosyltransferase involved in cell wall biosynthesis